MDDWFATWIRAMETDAVTVSAVGATDGGEILVSYGQQALVGATKGRAFAYA